MTAVHQGTPLAGQTKDRCHFLSFDWPASGVSCNQSCLYLATQRYLKKYAQVMLQSWAVELIACPIRAIHNDQMPTNQILWWFKLLSSQITCTPVVEWSTSPEEPLAWLAHIGLLPVCCAWIDAGFISMQCWNTNYIYTQTLLAWWSPMMRETCRDC